MRIQGLEPWMASLPRDKALTAAYLRRCVLRAADFQRPCLTTFYLARENQPWVSCATGVAPRWGFTTVVDEVEFRDTIHYLNKLK